MQVNTCKKLDQIGKSVSDVKGIFLTHAHPDHIGAAAWFQEKCECKIYASVGEKRWIENIDFQYKERPIPNYYNLVNQSAIIDKVLKDGDKVEPEDGLVIEVLGTPGHSTDELSFRMNDVIFIGDSIPVWGDIPIYIDKNKSLASMDRLEAMSGVTWCYPAWDKTYSYTELREKIADGKKLIGLIDESVKKTQQITENPELHEIVSAVCNDLQMPWLMSNPLFERTIKSHLDS